MEQKVQYEVHVAIAENNLEADFTASVLNAGLKVVNVSDPHHLICANFVFSYYGTSRSAACSVYENALEICKRYQDKKILVELEVVPIECVLQQNGNHFDEIAFRDSQLKRLLSDQCTIGNMKKSKRADIHLSLPWHSVSPALHEAFISSHVTFIKVIRDGTEEIPGGAKPQEEWIAYTIQLDGPEGPKTAKKLYKLIADELPKIGGYGQTAILKLEEILEFFTTDSHPGIPACVPE
ncbi:MAG: hypothetical protein HQL90_08995 [Magnetococcales bacterium]|nr:hypothetical protein [Magnetococcales bacterium]